MQFDPGQKNGALKKFAEMCIVRAKAPCLSDADFESTELRGNGSPRDYRMRNGRPTWS